jgi:hypothetical protein
MANFLVNIFGTGHRGGKITAPDGFRLFNIHVLQVEADVTVTNFDMFIEFYAFPFNTLGTGTNVVAGGITQPLLSNRKSVSQPQVIHLGAMTPNVGSPVPLYNCTGLATIVEPGFPTPPCSPAQNQSLPSCPTPSDFRLFSHPFQVKTQINSTTSTFDTKWSDIVDNTGTLNALSQVYYLPAKILIIADGCKYANEKAFIRILMNYKATSGTQYNLYGNASCWRNPTQLPLGNDDKILVN